MPDSVPAAQSGAIAIGNGGPPTLAADVAERLDGFVDRARDAATAFRRLDRGDVDRIVWAMVVTGLRCAVELAELAMEGTRFGVFEDKVVKNYIATKFLFDYLKDKRSVGVIAEDPERIQEVAEPIGVVLALTPITNPTSTVLFKPIVAPRPATRSSSGRRRAARAARLASSSSCRRRGRPRVCRPTRCRSCRTPRSTSRGTCSTTLTSTSSRPRAGRRPSPPRTRRPSRASASGPATPPPTSIEDPSIRTNPRIPLVRELTGLLAEGSRGW